MPGRRPRSAILSVLPAAVLALSISFSTAPADAGSLPTPEATEILTLADDDAHLVIGFAAPLPGVPDRIGLVVECGRTERSLYAALFFGFFPDGKPVQATVRDPDGRTMRLGPPLLGSRFSGFHDPEVHDRDDVLRLMKMAFAHGALLSNGHNAVWNRIPDADNREARRRVLVCAGEDS